MLALLHDTDDMAQMPASGPGIGEVSPAFFGLRQRGWATLRVEAHSEDDMVAALKSFGSMLGAPARGRAKSVEEILRPLTRSDAHPRSLSAIYGTERLPFHTELGHRRQPCRYLLLGCIDPGEPASATLLVDWTGIGLDERDFALLESAPILVRTGRRSFYSTILPRGREFLRFDPGCMEAVDRRGADAMRLVEERLAEALVHSQDWRTGDMLLVDNWRILHGREPSSAGNGRRLARVLIDE
jgi:hypothetical protein